MRNEWFCIINPTASKGKGAREWPDIEQKLKDKNIDFEYSFTRYPRHSEEIFKKASEEGYRKFVAVGGDGTANELCNAIMNTKNPKDYLLTMIPVGTGNDWGKSVGILSNDHAVETLKSGKIITQDVGKVTFRDGYNVEQSRYFLNVAGIGFDAYVTNRANKFSKLFRGTISYLLPLLLTIITYRSRKVEIICDDHHKICRLFTMAVGIGKYNGGGMQLLPNASFNDGLFDVTVVRDISNLRVLLNVHLVYNGKILRHPKVDGYRAKKVKIKALDRKLPIEADGEFLGYLPCEFEIFENALNVLVKR
jgi:YegS/Rv2252/BmrU family lipid kinase